jgi:hypothetical protein
MKLFPTGAFDSAQAPTKTDFDSAQSPRRLFQRAFDSAQAPTKTAFDSAQSPRRLFQRGLRLRSGTAKTAFDSAQLLLRRFFNNMRPYGLRLRSVTATFIPTGPSTPLRHRRRPPSTPLRHRYVYSYLNQSKLAIDPDCLEFDSAYIAR